MRISKKLIIVLSAVPLLASCGGVGWKNYSYKRALGDDEKAALLSKVLAATTKKLKRVDDKYYELSQNGSSKLEFTETNVIDIYKKGEMHESFVHKERDERAGKIKSEERKRETFRALFDEENHKFAIASLEENADLTKTYSYRESVIKDSENNAATDAFYDVIDLLTNSGSDELLAVEKEKGENFFIYSLTTESHTPENYGKESKVVHERTRTQDVVLLNDDFTIKTCTRFYTHETNKDSATNQFYKKMQLEGKNTREWKFTYGDREKAPASLDETRKNAKSGYAFDEGYGYGITGHALDKDGNDLFQNFFTLKTDRRESFSKRHVSFQHFNIPCKLVEEPVVTYKLKLDGESISNASASSVAFDVDIKINSLIAGNSGTSLSGGNIKMGTDPVDLVVEFDMEATSTGVKVSNVNAYASSYVYNVI